MQAESDLRAVTVLLEGGQYAQACFAAQQASEKALKALAFLKGYDIVKSHSLLTIAEDLQINGSLKTFASKLDIYYITSRNPDALPDHGVPAEKFDLTLTEEARSMAEAFIAKVKESIAQ